MRPNSTCLVVSTENVTQNWYFGNERSMLIANCLFRAGGAAVLLSNKAADYWRAKWVPPLPTTMICALPAVCSTVLLSNKAADHWRAKWVPLLLNIMQQYTASSLQHIVVFFPPNTRTREAGVTRHLGVSVHCPVEPPSERGCTAST